jgi:hypothetical protein
MRYIAVGVGSSIISYSYNGIQYNNLTNITGTINTIIWNGNIWVYGGTTQNPLNYSYDGITWNGCYVIPQITNCLKIKWNGKIWVAICIVGVAYQIYNSYDGINWSINSNFLSLTYRDLEWNGTMWLIITSSVTIYKSYDGVLWTSYDANLSNFQNILCIKWNGILWVIGGETNNNNAIVYSPDGISWTQSSISYSSCKYIDWNGELWIACVSHSQQNTIIHSHNGITWYAGPNYNINTALWNGNIWFAFNNNQYIYSNNGENWSQQNSNINISTINDLKFNNTRQHSITFPTTINICATNNSNYKLAYSINGIDGWTSINYSDNNIFNSIIFNGNLWLIGGDTQTMLYSFDGLNWNSFNNPLFQKIKSIIYANNMWIAVGEGVNFSIAYSYDGFTWFQNDTETLPNICNVVAFGNNKFIVGGNDGTLLYSSNGINWTYCVIDQPLTSIQGISFNGNKWIAINNYTKYAYSKDGIVWTRITVVIQNIDNFLAIANNQTMWIIVCNDNYIIYSYNVNNWTSVQINNININNNILWNGNTWLIGGNGSIAYSFDGINWYPSLVSLTTNIYSIGYSYNNTGYVYIQQPIIAGGKFDTGKNTLAFSYDGIKWIELENEYFENNCISIVWNGFIWMSSGDNDDINNYGKQFFSYDGINWFKKSNIDLNIKDIIWNGEQFIAVGGYRLNSSNGLLAIYDKQGNYISQNNEFIISQNNEFIISQNNAFINAVAYNGKTYIFTANNGIYYSRNINETPTIGLTGSYYDVAYNTEYFVCVGNNYITSIKTSSFNQGNTGINSIKIPNIFTKGYSIANNGLMFVAVGDGQYSIRYSIDGINWTGVLNSKNIFEIGTSICWTGKMWSATGIPNQQQPYTIAYSYNGITWYGVNNSEQFFASGTTIASNPRIGYTIVDSQLVLNNNSTTQTLDIVSGNFYDANYTNFSVSISANDL